MTHRPSLSGYKSNQMLEGFHDLQQDSDREGQVTAYFTFRHDKSCLQRGKCLLCSCKVMEKHEMIKSTIERQEIDLLAKQFESEDILTHFVEFSKWVLQLSRLF